jgi:hypothetical protein
MKDFSLTPDRPLSERDRRRAAMLQRIEREREAKREARVGSNPAQEFLDEMRRKAKHVQGA